LTVAGQVLGTPFYMSPEQWGEVPSDGNMEIDGRADIYSLGCVFYELLAGRRAFGGLTLQELRREHVSMTARPLHEFLSDVPEAFSRALARAMSKERNERQATAGELANELRIALGEAPLSLSQLNFNAAGTGTQGGAAQGSLNVGGASHTAVESPEVRHTSAEVINPTIMTIDSPPRPQANPNAPPPPTSLSQAPLDATSLAQPAPSYNSGYQASPPNNYSQPNAYNQSYNAPPSPSYSMAGATPATPARSKSVPIIAALIGVVLLAAGVGGFFLLRNRSAATDEPKVEKDGQPKDTPANKNGATNGGPTGTANTTEALTYWLEIQVVGASTPTARVAGVVPLASGQSFKLHFTPRENGYLYIVGPGEKNVPMTFLTAKPIPASGVKSNEVKSGADFSFPNGAGNWITLDKTSGTENYTVIFSTAPLTSPSYLNAPAAHQLTPDEQKEFEDFRAQFKANAPVTNVINGSGVDPLVSIKIPQAKPSGEPVIFDIRIEHK
jgi:hypothetical protein